MVMMVNGDDVINFLSNTENGDAHVFISYDCGSKSTVLQIRDRLKESGFKIWIDVDNTCTY